MPLARVYPPASYAAVFALIWFSYLSCDFASETFGGLFGKQTIAVWGLGAVNKKSIAGTASGFAAAVLVSALVVVANGLPPAWYALALVVAITSTALELRSPTPPARPPRRLSCPPTPSRRPRPRGPTARPSR